MASNIFSSDSDHEYRDITAVIKRWNFEKGNWIREGVTI
jgi:hypothetical protein